MRSLLTSTLVCWFACGTLTGLGQRANETPALVRPGQAIAWRKVAAKAPGHRTLQLAGWTIHVSDELRRGTPAKTDEALRLLGEQLQEVARVIPSEPLAHLRKVPIWLSPLPPGFEPKGEYHPDVGWLKEHHRDPAMAKAIQFTNIPRFAAEIRRMPMMVLHELAHAYHDRVLGFENAQIIEAYEQAVKSGKYDRVQESSSGTVKKAYALTDPKEYFAELTEAFFGVNDFYPFNRAQLRRHDPAMFDLLGKLWKLNRPAEAPR